jgi:hydrogenase-4 membrane subunit HyfE
MEKKLPLAVNIVLSSLSSFGKWPIDQIAGFDGWVSVVIAIVACIAGTEFGLTRRRQPYQIITVGVILVVSVFWYTYLLSRGGVTAPQLLLGLLLYSYIFFALCYALTHLELVVIRSSKTR